MNERPLWQPDPYALSQTQLHAFCERLRERRGLVFTDYASLHAWSIEDRSVFWAELWDDCNVQGTRGEEVLQEHGAMWQARWFPQARLNFAQNLLRSRDESDALIFRGEDVVRRRLSHAELYREVARCAAALAQAGVMAGDRVAAYMPNLPETVTLMLACASIGAIFSSASPDFGVEGVLDRFGQIMPKILVAADGALYDGKRLGVLDKLQEIASRLPGLARVVIVPYIRAEADYSSIPRACSWHAFLAPHRHTSEIDFAALPFAHPLLILYSSGTTGVPKCIIHSAGGTLLQHLKEHRLHCDIRPGDRLFYYTTCGWMMWNWLVSGLASGATLMLYDGSPFASEGKALWDYARDERCTHFGVSAKYIDASAKLGLRPIASHDLTPLRMLMSTGSPLVPEGFDYVYQDVKRDLCLASISGGTDIVSCFVLGNPLLPVWRGEIQCKGLGMAVEVWDDTGQPIHRTRGELICKAAFPSMPVGFWNDPEGVRYRTAYFDRFPGVWCHGDWCEETSHGGLIIHGRSDATLNPGGVRIGTAEIYRQVERLPEVLESLVIGQEWEHDVRAVLFVRLREGCRLTEELTEQIRRCIRENLSPRHVPGRIVQVPDIPRTRSGKLVELAVKAVVHGQAVKNVEALANPEALEFFRDRAELKA